MGARFVIHLVDEVILVYHHGSTVERVSIHSYDGLFVYRYGISKMHEFIDFAINKFERTIELCGCFGTHKIVYVDNNGFSR
jgi:hypothetical protein